MSETPAPYTADHAALDRLADALVEDILTVPDAEILAEFAESDSDPAQYAAQQRAQFVARLDNAALHAWVTAATDLFTGLLTASTIPADWPRDQAWQPTVQLYPTYRTRITALLAGNLPPDPLVGEVNRLCGLLDTAQTERALLRITLAEAQAEVTRLRDVAAAVTRHLPLRVGGTITGGLFDEILALDRALEGASHAE